MNVCQSKGCHVDTILMADTVICIIVEELGSTATQGFMLLGMCVRRGYLKNRGIFLGA